MFVAKTVTILSIILGVGGSGTTIPQPDGIVFGNIIDGGKVVGQLDDYVVLARVDSQDAPIAVYRMGDLPAAGDSFVLHLPHTLKVGTANPKPASPLTGDTARLFVIKNRGQEVLVAEIAIPASGKTLKMDLQASGIDAAAERSGNGSSQTGSRGGLCGSAGMIGFSWMAMGLALMRTARRRQLRA